MGNISKSSIPSRASLSLYVLIAALVGSIGSVAFMPYSALLMVLPVFVLALLVAVVGVWGATAHRTTTAPGLGSELPLPPQGAGPDPIPENEQQSASWPGVTMGEEYLTVRLSDLLRKLSDTQAEGIFKIARWETLPAGTRMAIEGSTAECIYIIAEGAVQLTGRSGLGDVTVRIAREGEAFPLAALLGPGELVTSAKAATEVSVLAIPRAELLDLCDQRPEIGMIIFKTTAEILADRYRSMLKRHLDRAELAVRPPDVWANV
jgi:CRP-like cAMP-binding protein